MFSISERIKTATRHYWVIAPLDASKMLDTFLAYEELHQNWCTLKALGRFYPDDPDLEIREGQLKALSKATAQQDIALRPVLDVFSYRDQLSNLNRLVAVLPLGLNESLADLITRQQTVEPVRIIAWLRALVCSLEFLHSRNYIFGMLQPELITLQASQETVLLNDIAIARTPEAYRDFYKNHPPKSSLYAAPEQLRGEIAPQSDFFALGVLAYQLLTGKNPPDVAYRVQEGMQTLDLPKHKQSIPGLATLISQLLHLDLHQRPASAKAILVQLEACLEAQAALHSDSTQSNLPIVTNEITTSIEQPATTPPAMLVGRPTSAHPLSRRIYALPGKLTTSHNALLNQIIAISIITNLVLWIIYLFNHHVFWLNLSSFLVFASIAYGIIRQKTKEVVPTNNRVSLFVFIQSITVFCIYILIPDFKGFSEATQIINTAFFVLFFVNWFSASILIEKGVRYE